MESTSKMQGAQRTSSDTPISPGYVKVALAVERYVLPCIYAFLAYRWMSATLDQYHRYQMLRQFPLLLQNADLFSRNVAGAALIKNFLLTLLMAFSGVTLLFSRAPVVPPDKLKHVIVPLAMSFYFILYGMVDRLPLPLKESLLPPRLQGAAAIGGLFLSTAGYAVAIWALIHLGRSFAILVSVRRIVASGPYAYVRHPIYLGYAIDLCGLLLVSSSLAMLILGAGFLRFLVVRARIEEEMLCETDEGYRHYVNRTGFIIPRSFKPLPQS